MLLVLNIILPDFSRVTRDYKKQIQDNTAEVPTVTVTKDTASSSAVMLTFAVTPEGEKPVEDTMTIDVYDDSCLAAKAVGTAEFDPTDIEGNCITDFEDFALMAATWLVDYILKAPVSKMMYRTSGIVSGGGITSPVAFVVKLNST